MMINEKNTFSQVLVLHKGAQDCALWVRPKALKLPPQVLHLPPFLTS